MSTSKAISTISFNTHDYLLSVCKQLVKNNLISFFAFIKHFPEDREEKEHFHVFLIPSYTLDTDILRSYFQELLPGEDKPRVCLPFMKCSFESWYPHLFYSRKFRYTDDLFETSSYSRFLSLKYTFCPNIKEV